MADKAISELVAAEQITETDMFVLEQNNTAKKLTGQILLNWLTKAADGHGGIQSIVKQSTSGLKDTYRITLADTTTFDFTVSNGKGISGIAKQSTSGLVDTYKISYNDGTSNTFTVTNGAKGDKGDNVYLWIKYASQKPTASSHSMSDIPDDWIGVYSGNSATAPTDYTQYDWFLFKGDKGDKGDPATIQSQAVAYQVSDSGTIIPSGSWSTSIPVVAQGKYLWTRTTVNFNSGDPVVSYSVGRMGLDGAGSVSSVAGISPDSNGNVPLTAGDVGALPSSGGDITGELKMNGQPISGLNPPTSSTQATNKGYVDEQVRKASPHNLLDNFDFRNPVNQRGMYSDIPTYRYFIDRWKNATSEARTFSLTSNGMEMPSATTLQQILSGIPSGEKLTFAIGLSDGTAAILTGTTAYTSDGAWTRFATAGFTDLNLYLETMDSKLQAVVYSKNEITIKWAALYEGEYTADTLPEYQPKGYAAELAECQRYYRRYKATAVNNVLGIGLARTDSRLAIVIDLNNMRANPTVTQTGTFKAVQGSTTINSITMTADAWMGGRMKTVVCDGLTLVSGSSYLIASESAETSIAFSADL